MHATATTTTSAPSAVEALALMLETGSLPAKDQAFATSLVEQYERRGLSEKQMYWVRRLTEPARPKRKVALDVTKVVAIFEEAKKHLKHPKVRFLLADETEIVLSVAGPRARVPGSINVATGKYGSYDNRWFGRLLKDGTFEPSRESSEEVEETLEAFAADPAGYAAKYGRLTGQCCFCGATLKDERSTEVGYGKTCAGNYGLPWGVKGATNA